MLVFSLQTGQDLDIDSNELCHKQPSATENTREKNWIFFLIKAYEDFIPQF